jgi:hypothetical protein
MEGDIAKVVTELLGGMILVINTYSYFAAQINMPEDSSQVKAYNYTLFERYKSEIKKNRNSTFVEKLFNYVCYIPGDHIGQRAYSRKNNQK